MVKRALAQLLDHAFDLLPLLLIVGIAAAPVSRLVIDF
jgi:hypothetical protein